MFAKSLSVAAALGLAATLVSAQTSTNCDPTKSSKRRRELALLTSSPANMNPQAVTRTPLSVPRL